MKLLIDGATARTDRPAPLIPSRMFEGRLHVAKDGKLSFPASQHNISTFLQYVPNAEIEYPVIEKPNVARKPRPPFETRRDPLPHQKSALEKHAGKNVFGLFYCPGGGKSHSLTTIALYNWCHGLIDAMIVVTPNALVTAQWARRGGEELGQIERDVPDTIEWKALAWAKTKAFDAEFEALLEFDGFPALVLNIDAVKTPRGKEILQRFVDNFGGRALFAVDESHLIKNTASARFKACDAIGSQCDQRAILTGTPIGKNLVDLWAQFKFLDEKIIGVRYKGAFMNRFCVTRWNGFGQEIVGHKNVEALYGKIDPFVTRITQDELGLEKVSDVFEFEMHPEQKRHYDDLKRTFRTQIDSANDMSVTNAISMMTRLQQISNGYLVKEDGEIVELPNARVEALQSWLETQNEDDKIMIWCRFRHDAAVIMKALGKRAVDISGNIGKTERIENVAAFVRDETKRFCVGTPDAAGTGVDGIQTVCNRAIRYSLSFNFIQFEQAENRTSRIGGIGTAFYTDLIGKGTLDKKILRNLTGKRDLSSLTLDDIRRMME